MEWVSVMWKTLALLLITAKEEEGENEESERKTMEREESKFSD